MQTIPRPSAARAGGRTRTDILRLLRRHAAPSWARTSRRRCPASMEGDPDGAGEVQLWRLRGHQPAAGRIPCDPPRLGGPRPPGHDPVREVWSASAAEPSSRTLMPGKVCRLGCRPWPIRWPMSMISSSAERSRSFCRSSRGLAIVPLMPKPAPRESRSARNLKSQIAGNPRPSFAFLQIRLLHPTDLL